MKKVILGSTLLAVLLSVFQVGYGSPQGSIKDQVERYRKSQGMINLESDRKPLLGGKRSAWTPSKIQLEVLRLSREFSRAAVFMHDVAQGLADLRTANPEVFEQFFGDKHSSTLKPTDALASDLEPSLLLSSDINTRTKDLAPAQRAVLNKGKAS